MSNYHNLLGIKADASKDDIKKAYRKMASKYHPDKEGGDEAKFKQVQEAYDRLSNPDKYRQNHSNNYGPESKFWDHIKVHQNETLFEELFRQREQQQRIIKMQFGIELESTLNDQKRTIHAPGHNIPPTEITIPAGIRHGESIKYSNIPSTYDNYSKELIIQFILMPHPIFSILQDIHLVSHISVDAFDVMLGSESEITTIDNKRLKIKIPAGSQPGTKLKIPGNGLRTRGTTDKRGDMYVIIDVHIPELDEREINIITTMRENKNE